MRGARGGATRVLHIGYVWPEPRSSAAGGRALQLVRAFGEAGFEVHYASPAQSGEHDRALRDLGVRTWPVRPNDPGFDAWVAELQPDIVVFERFMMEEQFGWRVERACPAAVRVLDTVDLHFLRAQREAEVRGAKPRAPIVRGAAVAGDASAERGGATRPERDKVVHSDGAPPSTSPPTQPFVALGAGCAERGADDRRRRVSADAWSPGSDRADAVLAECDKAVHSDGAPPSTSPPTRPFVANALGATATAPDRALREVAAIHRVDLALVLSEAEHALLLAEPYRVPERQLMEFGFCYDTPPEARAYPDRQGFAFIGNFRHEPNADAVQWLKREIWPLIRARLPRAEVHVYGAYAPREMMALDSRDEGFRMRGQAPDVAQALGRARVNLAPLRFGAGLKGKISDGWWVGTPCVTTEIGAEGMRLGAEFGGLVTEDPSASGAATQFAEAAVSLHEDPALWLRAQEQGRRIVSAKFNHDRNAPLLLERLERLRAGLDAHRGAGFVGLMLRHHHQRSTEYFSRWIESKTRPNTI